MDKSEILRYLGAVPGTAELDTTIERAAKEIEAASVPRWVYRKFPICVDNSFVTLNGRKIDSKDLAQHLKGCREAFLFAFTLGPGVDRLIRRYSLSEMPFVPVLQACASAYTEEYADEAQRELEAYAEKQRLYLRPRYSPGYGDFSLEYQKFLFAALDVTKKIGVSLTDSCFMIPFKSITAVIGLSSDPSLCHIGKCMTCSALNCPFRKEAQL